MEPSRARLPSQIDRPLGDAHAATAWRLSGGVGALHLSSRRDSGSFPVLLRGLGPNIFEEMPSLPEGCHHASFRWERNRPLRRLLPVSLDRSG